MEVGLAHIIMKIYANASKKIEIEDGEDWKEVCRIDFLLDALGKSEHQTSECQVDENDFENILISLLGMNIQIYL